MKKELAGHVAPWCDLTKPWPINRKPKIQYLEPTSLELVEKLYLQVIKEKRSLCGSRKSLLQNSIQKS